MHYAVIMLALYLNIPRNGPLQAGAASAKKQTLAVNIVKDHLLN
jgi:hypothetical protein